MDGKDYIRKQDNMTIVFFIVLMVLMTFIGIRVGQQSCKKHSASVEDSFENFVSLCEADDTILKKMGFSDRGGCAELLSALFSQQNQRCHDEFSSSKINENQCRKLIDACVANWVAKEETRFSKDFLENR